jgi:hypothetical protein
MVGYAADLANPGTQVQRYELATGAIDTIPLVP